MREKVGKSRNTVFFQWFGAPEGRKVGSLKRRVRSQLARWEMKNCTPLWREAHFQVKMYKTPQRRTTFGSCDVEKVHAVAARSTFPSQNVQNTPGADHFWHLRYRKKCTPLWREAHFEDKMHKTPQRRTTFGSWDVEKVHTVLARSTFRNQNVKNTRGSDHFWRFRCRFRVAGARDCAPLESEQNREGFVAFPKTMVGMGHLKMICKDAFSVAGAIQKTCSWEMLRGQGADFLRGVAFRSIRCAGLLRWFCVTGAALRMTWHQFSVAGAVL